MTGYQERQVTLAEMKTGQTGTVVEVHGGHGIIGRLDALGIRPGRKVTKLSSALFRGPVMLRVNSTEVALGFGMAKRIIVEADKHPPRTS
jgi:ferrous iron transport protein A